MGQKVFFCRDSRFWSIFPFTKRFFWEPFLTHCRGSKLSNRVLVMGFNRLMVQPGLDFCRRLAWECAWPHVNHQHRLCPVAARSISPATSCCMCSAMSKPNGSASKLFKIFNTPKASMHDHVWGSALGQRSGFPGTLIPREPQARLFFKRIQRYWLIWWLGM